MNLDAINRRLVLFLVVAALTAAVLWSARAALLPFVLGLVLAYLLAPLVARLHRAMPERVRGHRLARPLAILFVYFTAFLVVAIALAVVVPPVVRQAQELVERAPALADASIARIDRLVDEYYVQAPEHVRTATDEILRSDAARSLTSGILSGTQDAVLNTAGLITNTVEWLLALVVVPIWLVYILNDKDRVMRGALGLVPRDIRPDVEAVRIVCDRVLSGYVRGQLVVALILGAMVTVALVILSVPYALLLGFTAGVLGVIPFLGAILGAVPAVAVAASQSLRLAVLVVLAFVIVQQIDNLLVSPRLQGRAVALNPAVIMVVLVVGQTLMGPIGLLAAVPATAVLRDVVHYLYLRVGDPHPTPLEALAIVGYGENATALVREAGTSKPRDD